MNPRLVKPWVHQHDIGIREVYSHHQQSRSLDLPMPSSVGVRLPLSSAVLLCCVVKPDY
ncbi:MULTISPECIES: hypothetical protein [Leptolyngbya]|uniref:Uncharacterized protein n=1 Tax=Leptolyngbya boryana CZ1 TaxID=3060204 RepID=A0AA96WZY6_LEPBY|nr:MULTISPECIES: hypothetical protein [Leptolyngbya]MBD1857067.1 hypothetical protein [Leptolyngbya sp. FACHB-1624]MBD2368165.1 hypothetical protein [Leptolyngbya sp. FACHB-161]MBD2374798.1 hypothetical protein [Leptolyngbya sp. FACHB-238]MBD2399220.1 hypothetical protein [Leptolyngbya sp. FACHB-239]MBD2405225.1 hypothetical protein [Leptolyngbya sp. FACHB-402]